MDRNGFTAYMESKELAANYITRCIVQVELFFKRVKKNELQVNKADILKFLEHLKNNNNLQNTTRYHYLIALNHYFNFLYEMGQIIKNPCLLLKIRGIKRKTLYKIYTPEELEQLFDNYYQYFVRNFDDSHIPINHRKQATLSRERFAVILSIIIYQRANTGEIEKIETGDIDLIKATVRIRGGQHSNERTLPLKAAQTGLLIHYLQNTRPLLLEYRTKENNKLFFTLHDCKNPANSDNISNMTATIAKQLKIIDRQFLNFRQLRTSMLSFWIKTHGLRKAQYMAGHRYISTTESYLPNNIDGLINDINKLHPF
jgi:site-specific recombinase XerD